MYRNDSLLYVLTCVRIISSKRVHHVTTYLIHGVPTRLSVSRVENRIYMYHAAPFYRSASNQEYFSLPLFPSCLAPSSSCSFFILLLVNFRCLSSFSLFDHSFVIHPSVLSLYHLFFFLIIYPLSLVSPFYLITYLFSTVDLFLSRRSYFRVRFLPSPLATPSFSRSTPLFASPILLFSSAFDLYLSFAFRCLFSTLFFFGFNSKVLALPFVILKHSFVDISNFRYLFFSTGHSCIYVLSISFFFSFYLIILFHHFLAYISYLFDLFLYLFIFFFVFFIVKFFNFLFLLLLKPLVPYLIVLFFFFFFEHFFTISFYSPF